MTTAHLRSKINRYFNQCRDEGTPPTPAGLALALEMRTAELTQAPMDDESRRLIDRALQRIEVGTLELLLNKSAARGLEIILQNTAKSAVPDRWAFGIFFVVLFVSILLPVSPVLLVLASGLAGVVLKVWTEAAK